jgi:hypothetical protein
MSSICARICALSGNSSITGGSWATSVRTWFGWAVTKASPTTAPPLLPNTYAGPPPSSDSTWRTSSAWSSGVTSCAASSRVLLEMPRGSYVTTVYESASSAAIPAKPVLSIGEPSSSSRGPDPRIS